MYKYRPDKYDDWGVIKGPDNMIVLNVSRGANVEADFSQHRRNKTDPYKDFGEFVVAALNEKLYVPEADK